MNRRFFSLVGLAMLSLTVFGQQSNTESAADSKILNHMDIAVTGGSTGLGLDVSMPIGNSVTVRTGFTFVPSIFSDMTMGIQIGDDNLSQAEHNQKFDKMASFIEQYLGTKIDQNIQMRRMPNFNNFKLLVDVHPLRNKNWFVTGGFYWGPSTIARAENAAIDGTSLVGVAMYNKFYDAAANDAPIYGDAYLDPELAAKFLNNGRMSVHLGDFKDKVDENGNKVGYRLVPDENNMIKCKLNVNSFRPYLGFGYGGRIVKNSDMYHIYVSCGAMFWGGTPKFYTHDGVDLINDVENIGGSVGNNVKFFKQFKFFPVFELRLAHKIF